MGRTQKEWADYYCWWCGDFALAGGAAVWCAFFDRWMHVNCHESQADKAHDKSAPDCYIQQIIPVAG